MHSATLSFNNTKGSQMHTNNQKCSILATLYNLLKSHTKGPTQAWGTSWMHAKLPNNQHETILWLCPKGFSIVTLRGASRTDPPRRF